MDNLYEDLENYNDVNVIEELRNENKDLKIKLDECSLALTKLQKEFDKLSSDHKKLEMSYSSLLKTAKAEIERKTQAITNINKEKDMLVLNSIQNSNKSILVLRRHLARTNSLKSRKDDTETTKTTKKDVQEERLRNDENRLPSEETTSSANTNDTNNITKIEKPVKLDVYDKTSGSKENIGKGKKALSLKLRRKSMPVLNKQQLAPISSDEEFEDDCSEDIKRERFSREEKSRKYFDRHKISETSGIDEKYSSYHESSRETYYKGKSHRPMDKYRSMREKARFRKHFSPEKVRRPTRDYHEEEREELFRHNRVLVSPPREKINPLRMFRDRRSNHERDRSLEEKKSRRDDFDDRMRKDEFHEDRLKQREDYRHGRHTQKFGFYEERQRSRSLSEEKRRQRSTPNEERFQQKRQTIDEQRRSRDNSLAARCAEHDESNKEEEEGEIREEKPININKEERKSRLRKRQIDNDEPRSKRTRTDSCKAIDEPAKHREDMCLAQDKLLPGFAQHLQYTSCQSPDDPHHDTHTPIPPSSVQPKEIMATSSSYMEDPRLISKKYVQRVQGDKIVLETATGRNIDLIALDKSNWNIEENKTTACLQKAPEFSDKMVQEIYMNIENPFSSTLELGEIHSESNDRRIEYLSKNFYQDYENERINQIEAKADKNIENVKNKRDARIKEDTKESLESEQSKKMSSEPKLPPVKYKLTRPSNPEPKQDPAPNPLGILFKQLSVCGVNPCTKPSGTKLDVDATFGTTDDDSEDKSDKSKEKRQLRGRTISAQELVEGDLALSDETCDNVFTQRQKRKQRLKEKALSTTESNVKTDFDIEQRIDKPIAKLLEKKSRKKKTVTKVIDQKEEECKAKETESKIEEKSLKKTRKKRSPKQKTTCAKESKKAVNEENVTEKKTKGKKSKSPSDTKDQNQGNKFTELFGDSSSLMTPEDLGMVTQEKSEVIKKYVPIFEDAQDAIDVDVTSMIKKKVLSPSVTSSKIDEPVTATETKPESLICKIALPNKSISETDETKRDISKEITPNMEVSAEEATKDLDVVKTVIISTGVQPRIEDVKPKSSVPDNNTDNLRSVDTEIKQPVIPTALATSTPHKRLLLQLEAQIDCSSSCSSNEVLKDQSSASTGLLSDAQNDDAPDVRIVLKRRRRLKK